MNKKLLLASTSSNTILYRMQPMSWSSIGRVIQQSGMWLKAYLEEQDALAKVEATKLEAANQDSHAADGLGA